MKITIGAYDPATRTVAAKFEQGDIVHDRTVNACHGADGGYDEAQTKARVDEVARGVAVKMGLGIIANAPEPEDVALGDAEPTSVE